MSRASHQFFDIPYLTDKRGQISVIEFDHKLPFSPRRIFYVTNPNGTRGKHAHKTTSELIFMISGTMTVLLEDKNGKSFIKLENNNRGLFVPTLTWIEILNFSTDCIYAVMANEPYNNAGYIRDRAQFEQYFKE